MRFFTLYTFVLAATSFASPLSTLKPEKADAIDNIVVAREVEAPLPVVKKDQADDLSSDLAKLVGDVVYDVEGVLNTFGYNATEFFDQIGLTPPPGTHGQLIDGTRLVVDVIKDLIPIAIRFGINLLALVSRLI